MRGADPLRQGHRGCRSRRSRGSGEKSRIQTLDRTALCLPILPTTPAPTTHDYIRKGTTSLFAAFDPASNSVIAQSYRRHRHQEFLRFLKLIDQAVPDELDLQVVLDNYATHKTPEIHKWLLRHPRFHLHFTPTSSSWLNLVERWFGKMTRERIRRGVFTSVPELARAIHASIERNNADPKPFVWTKSAHDITGNVNRRRAALKTPPLKRLDKL